MISTIGIILYYRLDLFKEGLSFLSLRFEEAANVEGNPFEAYFLRYWDMLSAQIPNPPLDPTKRLDKRLFPNSPKECEETGGFLQFA